MLNFSTKGPKAAGSQANLRSLLRSRDFELKISSSLWLRHPVWKYEQIHWIAFFSGKSSPETHGISMDFSWFKMGMTPMFIIIPNVPHPNGWIHREINSPTGEENCTLCHLQKKPRLGFVCPCIARYTLGLCWWCNILNMFRFNIISQPICLVPSSIHPPTHAISLYVCIYIYYILEYIPITNNRDGWFCSLWHGFF